MNEELRPFVPNHNAETPKLYPSQPQDRFSTAAQLRAQLNCCWTALRRRWWVPVLSLLLILGPVIWYVWVTPTTYQSHAIMYLTGKLNLPGEGFYVDELTDYIATEAELIKSPTIMGRALQKILPQFPDISKRKTNAFTQLFMGLTSSEPATNATSVSFPFVLTIQTSVKNSILALGATGDSPEATKAFLDALVGEYLALKKEARRRNTSEALSSVTEQINGLEKQIQEQQSRMTLFLMSNNVPKLTDLGISAGSYLSKLAESLSAMRTGLHILDSLTAEDYKGLSEGPQVVMSDTAVPGETGASLAPAWNSIALQSTYYQALQQLNALKAQRDRFVQVLRPTHSKMVLLNQQIDGLEQLLKSLQNEDEQAAASRLANRKKALQVQIQNIEDQYRAWETNAAEASRKLTQYDNIKEDLHRSQDLYDRLLVLLQTVDLNHNFDQEPLVPLAPASPALPTYTKIAIVAAGLFLSALVGVGGLIFPEFLDDRFRSAMELRQHMSAPILGQIPEIRLNPPKGLRRLLPAVEMQPAFAESFRNLRSFLLSISTQYIQPKVILVTSAIPKEGKTTVASNLAAMLAQSGSRVLLLDADIRHGSVHRVFNVGHKPGLAEVLTNGVPAGKAIVPSADPNLFILPAGEPDDSTSDVFVRRRVDLLLQELAAQYSYVIIDSAPVLATDDAACLGSHIDGVLMVVRASYTSASMAREALDRLRGHNVKILGMVYNRAAPSTDYYCRYSPEYYNAGGSSAGA